MPNRESMTNKEYWEDCLAWLKENRPELPEPVIAPRDGAGYLRPYVSFDAGAENLFYAFGFDDEAFGADYIAASFVIVRGDAALNFARTFMRPELFQQLFSLPVQELVQKHKPDQFQLYLSTPRRSSDPKDDYRWYADQWPHLKRMFDYWTERLRRV